MGLPQAEDESTCVRTFGEFEFAISGIGDCHSDSSGLTGSTFGDNLPLVRFLFTGNTAFGGDLPSVVVSACRLRRLPSVCGCFLQPPSAAFFRLWQPFFCRFPPVAAGHPPTPGGGSPLRLGQVFERKVVVCSAAMREAIMSREDVIVSNVFGFDF